MTGIDALLHQPAAQAVGWALLHFIWQGTVIGVLTASVLLALRRSAADVRYVVSASGLALMLTLPIVTGVQTWNASSVTSDRGTQIADTGPRMAIAEPALNAEPAQNTESALNRKPRTATLGLRSSEPPLNLESRNPNLGAQLEPILPLLIGIWLAGVMLLSLRLFTGWLWIQRLRTHGAIAAGESWQRMATRLSRRLHIARTITLLESTLVDVPTVIGWVKPVVLLPASALSGLSAQQLEAILAHELAHIRRHDYLVNLLQTLVETLLFYHPAVWWLSRRIRAEREHCCDDLAVSLCGDPIAYANALADLESLRSSDHRFAMAATGGSLLYRIRRLIGAPPSHAGRGPAWLAGSAALMVLCGIALGADGLRQASTTGADSSQAAPVAVAGPVLPYTGEDLMPVLAEADAAIQAAMRALGLHPFLGALPWPAEGVIENRFIRPYEEALRVQELAIRAQSEAMLADHMRIAAASDALLDEHQAMSAQAEALAAIVSEGNNAPALAALDADMASASQAAAALSESTAPALAALGSSMEAAKFDAGIEQSISHRQQDDSSGNWTWSNNGEKLSVSYSGRLDFTDDDTDVREISSGGYLKISDAAWIGRHTVEIHERGGQLEHRYFVNGSERSYEPEGRQWLRETLPKFVRNTGIGAERRVARYLKSGGPSAVLAEIARIESSYVKRIYFTEFLEQATLTADQYRAVLKQAGREVNSDYELATLLIAIADKVPADEPSRAAYFMAASSISSDYELRRVYSKMLDKGPVTPAILESILSNTSSIESDYELAELLRQILGQQSLDEKTRPLFFKAVGSISSDYERHRVLSASLRGTPDSATVIGALNRAGDIGSDYEAAQFLLEVLQKGTIEGAAREPFFTVVNRLNSTYERRRVLEALIRKPGLSRETLLGILQSAREMSGYDLAQVLLAVANAHSLTGDLRDSYLDAADRLSGYDQGQVMTALVKSERRK